MKNFKFFFAALLGLVLLTSCDGDGGTAMTNKDHRWYAGEDGSKLRGYMDDNGNEIVSAKYDNIWPFTCGLAKVEKNGKWGYINTKGEEVIPCRYENSGYFYDDVAWVQKSSDSRREIINKKGETLFSLKEGEALSVSFVNGLALVSQGAQSRVHAFHRVRPLVPRHDEKQRNVEINI